LSAPYDILAEARGFNRLARATGVIGRYQGNVAAAKRSWATIHDKEVVGFIRAYAAAIDWLYDAANRDEAVRILTRHLPQMPRALAQQSYNLLLDREEGFFRRGKIDLDGLETVLQLRSRHAEPKTTLTDPTRYYDPAYHGMAMRR
jgi:ABC-type nitrate/sulfonate/bicarbonate transport system substrate-binding protein